MDERSESDGAVPSSKEEKGTSGSDPETQEHIADNSHVESPKEDPAKPKGPPMPPGSVDGGVACWLQVIGTFAMWANCWGLVNSYGVFQTYYEITNLSGKSPSQISWIGTLQAFLLLFVSVLSGPLFDAGYFQALNLVGNFMIVFGLMMTSLCDEYWQAILAQGFVVGIGCGLLFIPATGVLPQYWVTKRSFALSIAGIGSGLGGLIFPIVFRELQPTIGFGWAVRVIAFLTLFFGMVSNALVRNKLRAGKMRKLVDLDFFKNTHLIVFWIGLFFAFLGLYVPLYYIGIYALEERITDEDLAFYLVAIMQAGTMIGRIGPSFIADVVGPLNLLIPTTMFTGILILCWIAVDSQAGLIVFAIIYGALYGIVMGMAPPAAMTLMKGDMKRYGSFVGTGMLIASPGVLIGNPIAGAILRSDGGFVGLQSFSGSILLLAGILFIVARVMAVGWGSKSI